MSIAGRDKGNMFFIAEIQDNFAFIIDGRIHKVENPKLKKQKHLVKLELTDEDIAKKLINKSKLTNQEVKKSLKKLGGLNV